MLTKHFQQHNQPLREEEEEEEVAAAPLVAGEGGAAAMMGQRLALRMLRWKCARRAEPYARRLLRTAHRLFRLKRELERAAGDIACRRYEGEHIVAWMRPPQRLSRRRRRRSSSSSRASRTSRRARSGCSRPLSGWPRPAQRPNCLQRKKRHRRLKLAHQLKKKSIGVSV